MEGEQYGEVDEFQMRHEDPSDFLECLTWHQAIAKSEGYENEEIIIHYSSQFERDKPWLQAGGNLVAEAFVLSERQANLFLGFGYAISSLNKQVIKVLDIGGGNGYMAYWLRDFFPNQTFEWTILESQGVAESYNVWQENANVKWICKEDFARDSDVVLISCALQYIEHWEQLLIDATSNCNILFLKRLPVLDSIKHEYGVQRIFRKSRGDEFDASVPCHFFGATEIHDLVLKSMALVYGQTCDYESVIFKNNEVKFQNLLFKKL